MVLRIQTLRNMEPRRCDEIGVRLDADPKQLGEELGGEFVIVVDERYPVA